MQQLPFIFCPYISWLAEFEHELDHLEDYLTICLMDTFKELKEGQTKMWDPFCRLSSIYA